MSYHIGFLARRRHKCTDSSRQSALKYLKDKSFRAHLSLFEQTCCQHQAMPLVSNSPEPPDLLAAIELSAVLAVEGE